MWSVSEKLESVRIFDITNKRQAFDFIFSLMNKVKYKHWILKRNNLNISDDNDKRLFFRLTQLIARIDNKRMVVALYSMFFCLVKSHKCAFWYGLGF